MGSYLAEISLAALAIAVVIGIVRNVNVGPLSLAIALVVGYYIGGVKIKDIIAGYPVNVFLMLAGITYLFAIANINGTLEKLTKFAVRGVRGNVALLPIVLFLLAFALSSLGPGAITICALLAAPCMLLASQTKIPAFLMAVMVANGTQAGNMSPIAVAGVIVKGLGAENGLARLEFYPLDEQSCLLFRHRDRRLSSLWRFEIVEATCCRRSFGQRASCCGAF